MSSLCITSVSILQVIEKQRLIEFADSLRSKLNYFDELENVSLSFTNNCVLLVRCLNLIMQCRPLKSAFKCLGCFNKQLIYAKSTSSCQSFFFK